MIHVPRVHVVEDTAEYPVIPIVPELNEYEAAMARS
jgi:hypothetical protein